MLKWFKGRTLPHVLVSKPPCFHICFPKPLAETERVPVPIFFLTRCHLRQRQFRLYMTWHATYCSNLIGCFLPRNFRARFSRYQTSFSPSSPYQCSEWRSTTRDENVLAGDSRGKTWFLGDSKATEETTWRKVRQSGFAIPLVLMVQSLRFAAQPTVKSSATSCYYKTVFIAVPNFP